MTPPTQIGRPEGASSGRPELIIGAVTRDRRQVLADLVALTKPRVVLMVLVTTVVGYYVGLSGAPDYARAIHLLVGTLLAASGTMALNQYHERDLDGRMERTRGRPLPDGRLAPLEALLFGTAITVSGLVYLAAFVNLLAAAVTVMTVVLYLFVYTPLKLRSPLCTLVGAVPGALLTHAGRLDLHLAGAVLVFTVVPLVTARLRRTGDVTLGRASRGLLVLLGAQLLLGAGSYLARFSAIWIPGGQMTVLVVPVAHRLVASLILATMVALALRVVIASRSAAERQAPATLTLATSGLSAGTPPGLSARAPRANS